MCPGLVWLPVALKKCFDSARVGGFSSHSDCCQEGREGPISAQRGLWGHLGDGDTQGKVRAKCTHTRGQVAQGKGIGRVIANMAARSSLHAWPLAAFLGLRS